MLAVFSVKFVFEKNKNKQKETGLVRLLKKQYKFSQLFKWISYVHRQTVCIRQAKGYCCIQYQICPDESDAFSLDRKDLGVADSTKLYGFVDTYCTNDYLLIPGKNILKTCLEFH